MTLMLHAGAEPNALPELRELETPEGTTHSHVPIAHTDVVEMAGPCAGCCRSISAASTHGLGSR